MRSFKQKFCGIAAVLVMAAATAAVSPAAAVNGGGNDGVRINGGRINDAPPKPTLTAAAGSDNGTVVLTASVSSGTNVTKWQYNYKKAGDTAYPVTWQDQAGTTISVSITVSGLSGDTAYKFKVRAVDGADSGAESDEATATPTSAAPPKPTLSTSAGNGSVTVTATVSSDNSSAITKIEYTHKKNSDSTYPSWQDIPEPHITAATATSMTFKVDGLTGGTSYNFKVRAVNRKGTSPQSDAATATPTSAVPAKPAFSAGAGNGKVVLWASVDADNGSAVTKWQYAFKSNGNYGNWNDFSSSAAKLFVSEEISTGISNGTAYTFKVRAVNGVGNGADSDEITVKPLSGAPGAPSGGGDIPPIPGPDSVTVTRTTANTLTVTWTAVENSWVYHVECSTDLGATWTRCDNNVNGNTTTITGADDAKVYVVAVYADTPFGRTGVTKSDPTGTTSSVPPAPSQVTLIRTGNTLTAYWDATTGATGYEVQSSSSPNLGSNWTTETSNTSSTSHAITSIDTTKSYMVRVRAKKTGVSDSDWTTSATNPTGNTKPGKTQDVTVTRSGTTLTVNWSPVIGAGSYDVQTNKEYGNDRKWTFDKTGFNGTSTTITSIDANADYYVRVGANSNTTPVAYGDWSDSVMNRAVPAPAAPSSVTLTRRLGPNGTVMDLEWSSVTGAVSYEVKCGYIYLYDGMHECADNVTSTDMTISKIDRAVISSRYHFAAVRAKNSSGVSPWTGAFSPPTFVDDITDLTATRTTGNITLTWSVPDDYGAPIVKYIVLCSTDSKTTWTHCPGSPFDPSGTTGSTYTATLTGVTDTQAYDIIVRANSHGVASDWAEIAVAALSSD